MYVCYRYRKLKNSLSVSRSIHTRQKWMRTQKSCRFENGSRSHFEKNLVWMLTKIVYSFVAISLSLSGSVKASLIEKVHLLWMCTGLQRVPWHGLAGSSRSLGVSRSRNQDITIDSITNASRSLLNFAGQGLTRCPNFKNFWLVFNLWFRVVYEITSIVWTGNLDWNFAIWIKYFHIVKLQWKFTDMFRISGRVLKLK